MEWKNSIIHGDLFDIVPNLPDSSIDAVICSPPYGVQREKQYGGISEADYPEWTVSWLETLRPKLTTNASIAIVIRPHVKDGCLSDYVLRTRLAVRQSWYELDEMIWIKPTAPPIGHRERLRRSWESILWFAATTTPFCDTRPDTIATGSKRLGLESKKSVEGGYMEGKKAKSGVSRIRDYVEAPVHEVDLDPTNTHPAQYPERLANWLIRVLCPPRGMVFDPFSGSGTTLVAAKKSGRDFSGTEIIKDYVDIADRRLKAILNPDEIFNY